MSRLQKLCNRMHEESFFYFCLPKIDPGAPCRPKKSKRKSVERFLRTVSSSVRKLCTNINLLEKLNVRICLNFNEIKLFFLKAAVDFLRSFIDKKINKKKVQLISIFFFLILRTSKFFIIERLLVDSRRKTGNRLPILRQP